MLRFRIEDFRSCISFFPVVVLNDLLIAMIHPISFCVLQLWQKLQWSWGITPRWPTSSCAPGSTRWSGSRPGISWAFPTCWGAWGRPACTCSPSARARTWWTASGTGARWSRSSRRQREPLLEFGPFWVSRLGLRSACLTCSSLLSSMQFIRTKPSWRILT